jgi:hypothetical protein
MATGCPRQVYKDGLCRMHYDAAAYERRKFEEGMTELLREVTFPGDESAPGSREGET